VTHDPHEPTPQSDYCNVIYVLRFFNQHTGFKEIILNFALDPDISVDRQTSSILFLISAFYTSSVVNLSPGFRSIVVSNNIFRKDNRSDGK
jgi:hypothetical protein